MRLYGSFYMLLFANLALLGPFLPLLLESRDFTVQQVGFIVAAITLTKLVAPSFWGIISDRTGLRMRLIRISLILSFLSLVPLCWTLSLWQTIITLFVFNFFLDAAIPLFEVNTFLSLGVNSKHYGTLRGVGTIGYITALVAFPLLVDFLGVHILPFVLLILLSVLWLLGHVVPEATVRSQPVPNQAPFSHFFRTKTTWIYILTAVSFHASFASVHTFFSLYCQNLGLSTFKTGILWSIGPLLEIGIFIRLSQLLQRFNYLGLAALAFIVMTGRWLFIPMAGNNYWLLLFGMALHALCYAPFHGAMIFWAKDYFGDRHAGKAQGLYAGVAIGIGGPMGSLLSGFVWDQYSPASIFLIAAVFSIAGLLLLMMEYYGKSAPPSPTA